MRNFVFAGICDFFGQANHSSHDLIIEQHRMMARQLPWQYIAVIISLVCIMVVNINTAPGWLILSFPVAMILFSLVRLVHWIRANLRIDEFSLEERKKDIAVVTIMAPLTTTLFSSIAAYLLLHGDMYQEALTLVLVWGTVALSSYSMAAVPVAAVSSIVLSSIPVIFSLLYSRDYVLDFMALGFASLSLMSIFILLNSFRAIEKLVKSRSDLAARHEEIEILANTDTLTGLANRYSFRKQLEKIIVASELFNKRFAVIILDLDSFKQINNLFCHIGGDKVLGEVGERLLKVIGKGGVVARLSSDEFHIVSIDVSCKEDAEKLGQDIHKALRAPFMLNNTEVHISSSIGIAVYPKSGKTPGDLVKHASQAQNRAKLGGGGKTCLFTDAFEKEIMEKSRLEMDLRAAIKKDEIEVYFQPIVDLQTGRFVSFETLARWIHPVRGFVPPDVFIKMAEEKGLIEALSIQLLRKAALVATSWPSDVMLSFNLSAEQVCNPVFASTILAILKEAGLPPERFDAELTETAIMLDMDSALMTIDKLRDAGISISLDDFGTGYSSLSQIKNFPLDKLKIDKSFIDDICSSQKMRNIITAIQSMCSALEVKTVSEGIETSEQLELLQKSGGGLGQGYLFSKPVSAEHLPDEFFYEPIRNNTASYKDAA